MIHVYDLSRARMIEAQIAIPVEWDDDGSEGYLTCSQTLTIEEKEPKSGGIEGRQFVVVSDHEQGIVERKGWIVSVDYYDFVENFYGGDE